MIKINLLKPVNHGPRRTWSKDLIFIICLIALIFIFTVGMRWIK